jgi:hypothetical protein
MYICGPRSDFLQLTPSFAPITRLAGVLRPRSRRRRRHGCLAAGSLSPTDTPASIPPRLPRCARRRGLVPSPDLNEALHPGVVARVRRQFRRPPLVGNALAWVNWPNRCLRSMMTL